MISASQISSLTAPPGLVGNQVLQRLREAYRSYMPQGRSLEPRLAAVIEEVASSHGGFVRAQLAFNTLFARLKNEETAIKVGIGVEFFHTASLILDDLPCMDDATERRGAPCPHTRHGEAAAILGALAYINKAYALLWEAMDECPEARRSKAAALLESCLGVEGILNGQSKDVHFQNKEKDPETILQIADGKTGTLFRLCLVFPALLAGVSDPDIAALEDIALRWGRCYQILDDLKDCLFSTAESGKTSDRDQFLQRPNLVLAVGTEAAMEQLNRHLHVTGARAHAVRAYHPGWTALNDMQTRFETQRGVLHERLAGCV